MLRSGSFGLEREALRVTPEGQLALTPHPEEFGDKLGNPRITVDFSESQVEMITPPKASVNEALASLSEIRQEVERVLDLHNERLWPLSMPPVLPSDAEIPIARFSNTPEGRRRELYRTGLANRYGRRMQTISGIHFSFSYGSALLDLLQKASGNPDSRAFADEAYFRMARNFLRDRWLLVLLTGASPVADETFNHELGRHLDAVRSCCKGCCEFINACQRCATSLRVSRFGYADTSFRTMPVSFNGLHEYNRDLRSLMATRSERFAQLGVERDGRQLQMNDRVLQQDSEFYAAIRLKGKIRPGESHLDAMVRNGVHYAEVRLLDIDPLTDEGIDVETLRLLQVFLLNNLLGDEHPIAESEWERLQENHQRAALCGRDPALRLLTADGEAPLIEQAEGIFDRLRRLATLMDRGLHRPVFRIAVNRAWERLVNPSLLPSALIYRELESRNLTHATYGASLLQATPSHLLEAYSHSLY